MLDMMNRICFLTSSKIFSFLIPKTSLVDFHNRSFSSKLKQGCYLRPSRANINIMSANSYSNDAKLVAPKYLEAIKFCSSCGSTVSIRRVNDDDVVRPMCDSCNTVVYVNPKIVVGSIACTRDKKQVLLCKRAIPPAGKWTLPCGFLEMQESSREGAIREAKEEAHAEIEPSSIIAVYDILMASQVQILYEAVLINPQGIRAGVESQEVGLFGWDEIPWDNLAFSTVAWALAYYRDVCLNQEFGTITPQHRTKNLDGSWS